MASYTSTLRDASPLLDTEPERQVGTGHHGANRTKLDSEDARSSYRVGRILIESAIRVGRSETAAAAVEVFRNVLEGPTVPAFRNGLGASLIERARLEPGHKAVPTLQDAAREFQSALDAAARHAAPRAASLRYEINLAMALWMVGERTDDAGAADKSAKILRAVANELTSASTYWSHVHDNLGNALMALGRSGDAVTAYKVALEGRQAPLERGRSLNNLGTAHTARGHYPAAYKSYEEALALQPRDQVPLAWGRTQHNFASALLQEALEAKRPHQVERHLVEAVERFEAARQERRHDRSPLDWAVTTANLAAAYVSRGTQLQTRNTAQEKAASIDHIRHAVELYTQSLAELGSADLIKTLQNLMIALRIMGKISDDPHIRGEIRGHQTSLLAFANERGLGEVVKAIETDLRQGAGGPVTTAASAAGEPEWPTETYSHASKARKENIIQFLTRVWLPFIERGLVDLRKLRAIDPSAAKGIDNFTQRRDPVTGERQRLPPGLHIPTKKEINDRLAEQFADPGERPARLDWALRSRARRKARR